MKRPRSTWTIQWMLSAALLAACGGDSTTGSGDTVAPSITLTAPAAFADNLVGTLNLSASAGDNVGVSSVEYQVDGRTVASGSAGPTYAASVPTGNHASGQHVVRARARDVAGNVSGWSSATVRFGGSVALGQGFSKTDAWVAGLTAATAMVQAPDGRWFVAEQAGTVRIVESNGTLRATPFLQLGGVDSTGERGLIGLALHPDFASNGYVYVHYTTNVARVHNRISRFRAAPPSANVAEVGEEFIIDDLPTLGPTNHNGGAMHFGIDGKLYVGVGDNAVGTNSQDPNSPLGKLLRLNDNGSIPNDNPFTGRTGLARAIWASGLRNPFTFAVQPGSGRIHINDVGENTWEEINLGAAGANYGWPGSEGPDNLSGGVTAPFFAYKHNATTIPGTGPGGFLLGQSIAGSVFYPTAGPFPSELRGNYFFADFVTRFVGVIDMANGNAAYTFANLVGQPVDMRVGLDGALYVLTRNAITQITAP